MNPFSPPVSLSDRGSGRTDLAVKSWVRAVQAGVAAAFLSGTLISGDPLWLAGTAVCLLAVLSEDRWIIDAERRIVRRRYGILPLPRVVDLSWDEIEAVFLETVESPTVEETVSSADSLRSLLPRLLGKGRKGWACWGFVLGSGSELAVRADLPSAREAVRIQAARVASILGVPLRGA